MPDWILEKKRGGVREDFETGLRLADLPEAEGGWSEYFAETDEADMRIEDEQLRSSTALILENAKQWVGTIVRPKQLPNGKWAINEATRSAQVGGFSDFLFPLLRAAFPTNPINELVSVQPTTRKIATIMYWNYVFGTTKGGYTAGQRAFDANVGRLDSGYSYTSEEIASEAVVVVLTNGSATATGTLAFHDGGGIRPNTVAITDTLTTAGTVVFVDDGNGAFVAPTGVTITSSAINYQTGVYTITVSTITFTDTAAVAAYSWDSEGSCNLPEMDVALTAASVDTQRRAMRVRYTIEALQDYMAEFGASLEPQLISVCAEELNYEIARQIIHEIWISTTSQGAFSLAAPSGISQQQHFTDFQYQFELASNSIMDRTQRQAANWIVCDSGGASFLAALPNGALERAPRPASGVQGLHFIGTLWGQYRVYKDLLLKNEPGAASLGNFLFGYKGDTFFDAGYVFSPYQLLYTTDSIPDSCFTVAKGMASRYATRMVNPAFYTRMTLAA